MTLIRGLHEFCMHMTYGYDPGVTQIWVTPLMYERLLLEMWGNLRPIDPPEGFPAVVGLPPYIEFEGRRIYRGD